MFKYHSVEEDLPGIAKKIVEFLKEDLKAVNEGAALESGNLAQEGEENGKSDSAGENSENEEAPVSEEPDADQENSDGEPEKESEPEAFENEGWLVTRTSLKKTSLRKVAPELSPVFGSRSNFPSFPKTW